MMRTNFDNIAFLELYRDLPVLWDKNHPDYKNRKARDDAEDQLMELVGEHCATRSELRNKIRSLRNTYNLELQRINKSIKEGADPDEAYKPKLVWFSLADSFLSKIYDDSREVAESGNENGQDYEDYPGAGGTSNQNIDFLTVVKHENLGSSRKRMKKRDSPKRKMRKGLSKTTKLLRNSEELVGANEFVVFGQLVAIQLEKLPQEAAIQAQQEIQTIINRARLESMQGRYEEVTYLEHNPISDQDSS